MLVESLLKIYINTNQFLRAVPWMLFLDFELRIPFSGVLSSNEIIDLLLVEFLP